jgi:NAD(P)-dependent dehydrogenase (short-subunit alcohol dehydrogenase family)
MAAEINRKAQHTAVVTGAAGTIGRAVVRRLAAEGWQVAGIDLRDTPTDFSLRVDVTDRAAMAEAADRVADKLGPIGLLVTAAGDHEKVAIGDMAIARWQQMLDVWLGGTTNACAAVVPQMIEAGCGTVVLLSSDLSSHGKQNSYVAAASGAVIAFAKSFGCEVAADGVRVNCLAIKHPVDPGWVAETVRFLANDGQYYAAQVMFLGPDYSRERGNK